jgi:hypothetical protein
MLTLHTNLAVKATTQLTGYDFNSYCRFGDHFLAASGTKLCEIGGEAEDGVDIAASFETFLTKLGHDAGKRLHFIYLGIETEGTIRITPYVDGAACQAVEFSPAIPGKQFMRAKVGRGKKGAYWSFRVENVDGCWFSIDEVHVLPVYLPLWQG